MTLTSLPMDKPEAACTPEAGILTEEMIEKGARAIYGKPTEIDSWPSWEHRSEEYQQMVLDQARACLTAALPHLVEACAKYLNDLGTMDDDETKGNEQAALKLEYLARSLTHSSKGE
jgi:hypothetical protein